MKNILISIRPQWVEKILNGEKTIEIRKTMPKQELPCKVYIYCTATTHTFAKELLYDCIGCMGNMKRFLLLNKTNSNMINFSNLPLLNGKIVAEFTLNEIKEYEFELWDDDTFESIGEVYYDEETGEREVDILETDWEIEDAKCIKESCLNIHQLREYLGKGISSCYAWQIDNLKIYETPKKLSEFICRKPLKYPPQNWCYVEK